MWFAAGKAACPVHLCPTVGVRMIAFQGRRAWRIENEQLRITILECGGHIAEIVCKSAAEINPLWTQDRPTIDSDQFDPDVHGPIYGIDAEARLISGLMGHNLCFPSWGAPSASEHAAGMTFHGESNILRWEQLAGAADSLRLGVTTPNCSIRFERELQCAGNVVYVSETVTNLSAWDRPVGWCEHVSLGPPFVEARWTRFESNLTRGFRTADPSLAEFAWPQGRGTTPCVLTEFSTTQHADLVNSFLIDPSSELGYFVAWHPRLSLLFGYVFLRREFPWMNVWEDHSISRQVRGMEFSNTPIDGTLRQFAEKPRIWGVPAFDWLDAKGILRKSYAAFAIGVPADFKGVAEVAIAGAKLTIREKLTGGALVLDWAPYACHGMAGL